MSRATRQSQARDRFGASHSLAMTSNGNLRFENVVIARNGKKVESDAAISSPGSLRRRQSPRDDRIGADLEIGIWNLKLTPAKHNMFKTCGIIVMLEIMYLCVLPAGVFAWTSAGPWGGVIHDLANAPAGGSTLFAGTGNGLYRHNAAAGGAWEIFDQTLGYRVLQVQPDTANGKVYAIVRETDDNFDFDEILWSGDLYELDLATGNFSYIFSTPVSSTTLCGEGDVLISTFDEEWVNGNTTVIVGYVYRRTGGGGWTRIMPYDTSTYPPSPPGVDDNFPIHSLLGNAGSSTVFMARKQGNLTDVLISSNDSSCGNTWLIDQEYLGIVPTAFGRGGSVEPLLGTAGGVVYERSSSGIWQTMGSGLPAYPVVRFINTGGAIPGAVLRPVAWQWDTTQGVEDLRGGIYEYSAGNWDHTGSSGSTGYDYVSSRVSDTAVVGSDLWVAYDDAGIWRYPGGVIPGEERDEGIAAVNLSGMVIDPRSEDRAIAFGASGVYERLDGTWSRLLLGSFASLINSNADFGDVVQSIRERGFQSAAISYDDPGVIWLGGMNVAGLLKGTRTSPGPSGYTFDQVYWQSVGSYSKVTDILVDPFDSEHVWFSTWSWDGLYETVDGGITYQSLTDHIDTSNNTAFRINDLETDHLEPASRTILAAKQKDNEFGESHLLVCEGAGLFEESGLYTDINVGAVAVNPQELGLKKAVAGPANAMASMAVMSTTAGAWELDPAVAAPMGLPAARIFAKLAIPIGYDADDTPDAFTVVNQNGTEYWGLFHSTAQTYQGNPGESWVEHPGLEEIVVHRPSSITVDPKDGNILWVTTQAGSAYTLYGTHFSDQSGPCWPGSMCIFRGDLTVDSSSAGDTLKVQPSSLAADTVSAGSTAQLVRMDLSVTNTIDLSWTAPGDDGDMPGWADRYELYYASAAPIADSSDFSSAYTAYVPPPHIAHRVESYSLNVSSHLDSWYSIALVSYDDENRASMIQTVSTGFSWDTGDTSLTGVTLDLEGDYGSISAVRIYRDANGSGDLEIPGDTQIGSSTSVTAQVTVPVSSTLIDDDTSTIFVVCDISSAAASGESFSLGVTGLTIDTQDGAFGLPAWSGTVALLGSGDSTGTGGGGGGGCFIATAAYGSVLEPEVDLLRAYRDGYLVHRTWGRKLVQAYYRVSPEPAAFIARHPKLRAGSRVILWPVIKAVEVSGGTGALPVMTGVLILLLPAAGSGMIVMCLVPAIRRKALDFIVSHRQEGL